MNSVREFIQEAKPGELRHLINAIIDEYQLTPEDIELIWINHPYHIPVPQYRSRSRSPSPVRYRSRSPSPRRLSPVSSPVRGRSPVRRSRSPSPRRRSPVYSQAFLDDPFAFL